jgi:hypothetical protein
MMAKSFNVGEVVYHDDVGECVIREVKCFSAWGVDAQGEEVKVADTDHAEMLVLVYEGGELSASPDQVWTKTEWESFWGQDRTKMFGSD